MGSDEKKSGIPDSMIKTFCVCFTSSIATKYYDTFLTELWNAMERTFDERPLPPTIRLSDRLDFDVRLTLNISTMETEDHLRNAIDFWISNAKSEERKNKAKMDAKTSINRLRESIEREWKKGLPTGKQPSFTTIRISVYPNSNFIIKPDILEDDKRFERLKKMRKILTILGKFTEIRELQSCVKFQFNHKKFIPIGGIDFPRAIPLSRDQEESLGKASFIGGTLSFDDSPLGINKISITGKMDIFEIDIVNKFKTETNDHFELLNHIFQHMSEVVDMLVIRK